MTRLTPEQQFVLASMTRVFGQDKPGAEPRVDWEQVLTLAENQGLAALVYLSLAGLSDQPPDKIRTSLRAQHAQAALFTKLRFEPTLRCALETLDRLGLEPLVLKGAALGYLVYPRPSHRTLVDIDLLLPSQEIECAGRGLVDAGFRIASVSLQDGHHHLPPFYLPDHQVALELHHHVLPQPNPFKIDLEQLMARSQFGQVAGIQTRVLSPEDALHHICVHLSYGHRYRWFPLRSLVDILALSTRMADALDWDVFEKAVWSSRTSGAVYWPLRLSRQWLGAPIPDPVLASLAPPPDIRRLLEPVLESSYTLDNQAPAGWGTDVLYNLLRELSLHAGCSVREQVEAVRRGLFPAPDGISHLPPQLTRSRLRYAAYLGGPGRVARGVVAVCRLLAQLPKAVETL
jgi:hypothetical protein